MKDPTALRSPAVADIAGVGGRTPVQRLQDHITASE